MNPHTMCNAVYVFRSTGLVRYRNRREVDFIGEPTNGPHEK